jgi:hypothetical protein
VVSFLAIGPKIRGFKPGRLRLVFKYGKNHSTTSLGSEIKQSVPCCKILRHVENTC